MIYTCQCGKELFIPTQNENSIFRMRNISHLSSKRHLTWMVIKNKSEQDLKDTALQYKITQKQFNSVIVSFNDIIENHKNGKTSLYYQKLFTNK